MDRLNWILPENLADLLPEEAARIESARRAMLDRMACHGYRLVVPPLLEYIESLLLARDADLDLKTFKLIDRSSGRQMGLRADLTPQVARIDAHVLHQAGITRLCYVGPAVHTVPEHAHASREPLQIGAEIYGCATLAADIEIIELMLDCLSACGFHHPACGLKDPAGGWNNPNRSRNDPAHTLLDIGHMGIFTALVDAVELTGEARLATLRATQRKDIPALRELLRNLPQPLRDALLALPQCLGQGEMLERMGAHWQTTLATLPVWPRIDAALGELRTLDTALALRGFSARYDLAELTAGDYHTGLTFCVYAAGWPGPIARGGRYDQMGVQFGRARAATGFSLDLKTLASQLPASPPAMPILAPVPQADWMQEKTTALARAVRALRAAGETVIVQLPADDTPPVPLSPATPDTRTLRWQAGQWQVG